MIRSAEQALAMAKNELQKSGLRGEHHIGRIKKAAAKVPPSGASAAIERECERILAEDSFDAVIGF